MAAQSIASTKSIDNSIDSTGVRMVESIPILDTSEFKYYANIENLAPKWAYPPEDICWGGGSVGDNTLKAAAAAKTTGVMAMSITLRYQRRVDRSGREGSSLSPGLLSFSIFSENFKTGSLEYLQLIY
jgi:hypothetical protein